MRVDEEQFSAITVELWNGLCSKIRFLRVPRLFHASESGIAMLVCLGKLDDVFQLKSLLIRNPSPLYIWATRSNLFSNDLQIARFERFEDEMQRGKFPLLSEQMDR